MKINKAIIIVFVLMFILVSVISVVMTLNYIHLTNEVFEFSIHNYEENIKNFPLDKNVGDVKNSTEAKKIAEELWIEIYGKEITKNKPFVIFYDTENQAWLIRGTLRGEHEGGVPFLIVTENGDVLAVWHEK